MTKMSVNEIRELSPSILKEEIASALHLDTYYEKNGAVSVLWHLARLPDKTTKPVRVPSWTTDFNAIHALEITLSEKEYREYKLIILMLLRIKEHDIKSDTNYFLLRVPADIRARALLFIIQCDDYQARLGLSS